MKLSLNILRIEIMEDTFLTSLIFKDNFFIHKLFNDIKLYKLFYKKLLEKNKLDMLLYIQYVYMCEIYIYK